MKSLFIAPWLLIISGCSINRPSSEINVAAAANLQRALEPLAKAFKHNTGVKVVSSLGSSTQLAQQIENGAPFDVFLSADTAQVDRLSAKGLVAQGSQATYARGVLVLWAPKRLDLKSVQDLSNASVKRIGIANPELAPYGRAAIETLTALGLWPALEPKVVYGPNIAVAAQFSESGNADVAFTALSLVNERVEKPILIPESLHRPIEQALCVIKASPRAALAKSFTDFIMSKEGQAILAQSGYGKPA